MGDEAQDVAPTAIGSTERDEGPSKIVLPSLAQPDAFQILVELLQHVVRRPAPSRAGRNDQVRGLGRPPRQYPPTMLSPSGENLGEDWMDRDGTRDLGLHRADNLVSGAVALGDEQPP
ncbi:MAG: hypothetical protein ACLP66_20855 [Polyangia bacterium]